MTTKEKIIDASLTLFSTKGYAGTSVKNIAEAVGIKDSSLYKHFKSKKEIFDTIVRNMRERMSGLSVQFDLPGEISFQEAARVYGSMNTETLVSLSRQILSFYLKDEFVSRFLRMATMEQYRDQEVYRVYRQIFLEESIEYQKELFAEMINQGSFVPSDPSVLAMSFYTPIFFLICKYIQEPEKEAEALEMLERQIREFARIYTK